MKEEINIVGNQYNYFTTLFNVGYVLVIYPSCIAVSHLGPHYWLPSAELIWGVLTCCLSVVSNYKQVYALRFLIGFAEGTAWPGYITVMSQWYMPHEVALRMGFFTMAQSVGSMFAGVMQGALSTTLDGSLGRSGWRWGFIVNGVCTIFVALLAYFTIPGFPDRPNPLAKWYLSSHDYEIARRRLARVKREPLKPINAKSFLKAFKYWQLWAIACESPTCLPSSLTTLTRQSPGHSATTSRPPTTSTCGSSRSSSLTAPCGTPLRSSTTSPSSASRSS